MRLIKKIKRFFFGIFQDDEEGVDESSYLHSQIESANQRIERLQDEMIHVLNELNKIKRPNG